ncbi:hypothetical protein ACTWP5_27365 [Streptomyces sp. 4N509B]|uniref:hypothetical protein n=1 Tax=Streptomyces sp. 4N509B TaxID=3457413 RepID=UPI003FD36EBE
MSPSSQTTGPEQQGETGPIGAARAALASIPPPPWRWTGTRNYGGPALVTDHSGQQYLLGAAKPTDATGEELLDPTDDSPVYGDLMFRDQRDGAKYAVMRPGAEMAVGRTSYDPDSIVDVDNPVARWLRDAPQHLADALAAVDQLRAERDAWRGRALDAENRDHVSEACIDCGTTLTSCPTHSPRAVVRHLTAELAETRSRVGELEQRLHAACMTRTWTNEDGKKFVFVEDIAPALLGKPGAADLPEPVSEQSIRNQIADDFTKFGERQDTLSWGEAVVIAREGLCRCRGGRKPCQDGGAR